MSVASSNCYDYQLKIAHSMSLISKSKFFEIDKQKIKQNNND